MPMSRYLGARALIRLPKKDHLTGTGPKKRISARRGKALIKAASRKAYWALTASLLHRFKLLSSLLHRDP